ncbi:MAG TPA: toll/interleukin-1 receptor domain-containing protein, partial [Steroidobacteraceae bacterium]|nr:toll/interleukin-1 receptor domain-containing protein [Steroidobacteraceae bacterium]
MASEVFISYRRSDQEKARLLHALLKQRGVDAWYDALVGAGADWRRATAKALDAAPIFVLLFSKNAAASDDIGKELAAATFSKKLVIPVRIEDIKPSGEFLYELASRNWFDAFEDTEARFVVLADRLAALVKGGPDADVAAFNLGTSDPPPVIKPVPRPLFRRPFVLGSLTSAALALVAAVAIFSPRPQVSAPQGAPTGQLVAFFGFTPTGDAPGIIATAEAATDRMFQTMGSTWLGTVARTETRGTPEDKRFARAAKLGALYALSGEMRASKDGVVLAVRFEDVPSRMALWENVFTTPTSDAAHLPAQAARRTAEVMWCITKTRAELTRDTIELLNLIADRCRQGGGSNNQNASYNVARMRAVAAADPASVFNQAQLVFMLGMGVATAPPSAQAAWIAEAEAVLKRATELDPQEPGLYLARITLAYGKSVPLAEMDAIVLEALTQSESKDTFVFGEANVFRYSILRTVGRFREALPHAIAASSNDLLTPPITVGMAYSAVGRTAEARAELEPVLAAYGGQFWGTAITHAIFLGAADAAAMLASPPSAIPKTTIDCLRGIHKAHVSTNANGRALGAKQASSCSEAGVLSPLQALASLAALGNLDAAFTLAGRHP